jgi:hypothetical protein
VATLTRSHRPSYPQRHRPVRDLLCCKQTVTSRTKGLGNLPPKVRKSGRVNACLYFRHTGRSVTIAPAPFGGHREYPQRCPQVQWNDRPTAEARARQKKAPVAGGAGASEQAIWGSGGLTIALFGSTASDGRRFRVGRPLSSAAIRPSRTAAAATTAEPSSAARSKGLALQGRPFRPSALALSLEVV